MEPVQFEEWIIKRLRSDNFEVNRTPTSHDGGADVIAKSRVSGNRLILQCKHTQRLSLCDDRAVNDLVRAATAYGGGDVTLVAVTNARGYTRKAQAKAAAHDVLLLDRAGLEDWPSNLYSL